MRPLRQGWRHKGWNHLDQGEISVRDQLRIVDVYLQDSKIQMMAFIFLQLEALCSLITNGRFLKINRCKVLWRCKRLNFWVPQKCQKDSYFHLDLWFKPMSILESMQAVFFFNFVLFRNTFKSVLSTGWRWLRRTSGMSRPLLTKTERSSAYEK